MKIHFVGIGGIGVSALAKYYLKRGHQISGSDLVQSEITDNLENLGAKVFIGQHKIENLPEGTSLVIYSPAAPLDNLELKRARELGLKCLSYPEALGELTKKYFTIAISGTHGKSTTTAMIGLLLERAGFDPTVIVGTKVKELGNSNCRVGEGKYLVIEADEWKASFLHYWPKIIVLTNIEREHLDFFKDLNHILKTYTDYIGHLPKEGILVANKDEKNVNKLLDSLVGRALNFKTYSLSQKEAKKIRKILKIPGEHNVSNGLAALAVARVLEIPDKITFQALSEYKGTWRRFDITKVSHPKPYTLINDYGHHPTEIRVTLKAAREKFLKKKIWCIFQPHQYQRTHYLWKDFIKVFKSAPVDKLIVTDIYDVAGREKKEIKERISSKKLVKAVNKKEVVYLPKKEIIGFLKESIGSGEVVIIMGAGDIYNLSKRLTEIGNKKKIK